MDTGPGLPYLVTGELGALERLAGPMHSGAEVAPCSQITSTQSGAGEQASVAARLQSHVTLWISMASNR